MDASAIGILISTLSSAACLIMTTVVNLRLTHAERTAAMVRAEANAARQALHDNVVTAAEVAKLSAEEVTKLSVHVNSLQDKLVEATRSDAFQKGAATTTAVAAAVVAAAVQQGIESKP